MPTPKPAPKPKSKSILIFVADDYEDLELWYPRLRLIEAGHRVALAGPAESVTYHSKHGYPAVSDLAIASVKPVEYDGLVIPGGWMPDRLRRDPDVLRITRQFAAANKMIASICHGPSIDISSGIVKGVRYTSSPAIKDDMVNAGAKWFDAPVVVDGRRVSSRKPADLPEFCRAILGVLGA